MFSSFKLPSLRTRSKSLSQVLDDKNVSTKNLAPQTPILGATPKIKKHKRRTSDVGCSRMSKSDQNMNFDQENFYQEYFSSENSLCVGSKVTNITLERSEGSIGVTLRGGANSQNPMLNKPLVVTHVKSGGPAYRCGRIKVGDRILRVDNQNLTSLSLLDAQKLLQTGCQNQFTTLTVEYDVNVMESVKYATGPLIVEVERHKNEELGLVLTDDICHVDSDSTGNGIYIERIIPASVSDRCGALHVGDQILGVDDRPIDAQFFKPDDVLRLLQNFNENFGCSKLQILPFHVLSRPRNQNTPSLDGISTTTISNRKKNSFRKKKEKIGSFFGSYSPQLGVCHTEILTVCIQPEKIVGHGLEIDFLDKNTQEVVITNIIPNSPAYKCGKLQIGDRIISVNHQYGLNLDEILSLLNQDTNLILEIEFDVADTIVPTSGIFNVKLGKWGPGLGITITASKLIPNDPFIITDVRKGSIAYRTGSLNVGDRLLAINGKNLDHSNLENAFEMLQESNYDVITLQVEKGDKSENYEENGENSITYTVEIPKKNGSLGITICGSESGFEGVILAKLTEGGIAEKTGALHVGDRILAINGEIVEKRPLSEAIRLLQMSEESVQLKISRNFLNDGVSVISQNFEYQNPIVQSPGLHSVTDSAVESWDSGIIDSFTVDTNTAMNKIAQVRPRKVQNFEYTQPYFYSDTESCSSPLPLPEFSINSRQNSIYVRNSAIFTDPQNIQDSQQSSRCGDFQEKRPYDLNEIHNVRLYKDQICGDFGFTITDGLYQTGVYVDTIRPNGPAHTTGALKPYDRIIKINNEKTAEYDVRLAYPLIMSSGDRIDLVISRNPYLEYELRDLNVFNWTQENFEDLSTQNVIVKTL